MIQKIIGVSAPVDPFVAYVLCGSDKEQSRNRRENRDNGSYSTNEYQQRNYKIMQEGQRKGIIPPCSPIYHYPSSCVGILLASYMVRYSIETTNAMHDDNMGIVQDVSALLSWIDKFLVKCKDIGVAYAIDILSVVANHVHKM
jgi:hypothetical protein